MSERPGQSFNEAELDHMLASLDTARTNPPPAKTRHLLRGPVFLSVVGKIHAMKRRAVVLRFERGKGAQC